MTITSQRTFSERAATASLRWSSAIVFVAQIGALWWIGTLIGAVIAGFAPSSVACAAVVRARVRGDLDGRVTSAFFAAYRLNFGAATVALLPTSAVAALVASATAFALQNGLILLAICAIVVAVPLLATLGIVPAMLAHYELAPARVPLVAWRFSLRNPGLCVQLLLSAGVIVALSVLAPAVGLLFGAGVWLLVSTYLCLHRFAANDRLVGENPTN